MRRTPSRSTPILLLAGIAIALAVARPSISQQQPTPTPTIAPSTPAPTATATASPSPTPRVFTGISGTSFRIGTPRDFGDIVPRGALGGVEVCARALTQPGAPEQAPVCTTTTKRPKAERGTYRLELSPGAYEVSASKRRRECHPGDARAPLTTTIQLAPGQSVGLDWFCFRKRR